MVIKCPICGKDDFKNEGGLKSHRTWKHSSSPDGRGLQPSTSARVQRDNGARPKNNILGQKDHYGDKDIIKDVAREVQRDSRPRGSLDVYMTNSISFAIIEYKFMVDLFF